jgi:DNA helicase II / ATP-dependent DNA helicase PcrA
VRYQSDDGYALLKVGRRTNVPTFDPESGRDVRRSREGTSSRRTRRPQTPTRQDGADSPILQRLRAWRLEQARKTGVSTDMVLSDKALSSIAHVRPATRSGLALCADVKAGGVDRYGDDLIAIVREFGT